MAAIEGFNATGRLLEWSRGQSAEPVTWFSSLPVEVVPLGVPGWSILRFRSDMPLLGEEDSRKEWVYPYLLRESGNRLLLLSSHSELTLKILDLCNIRWRLSSPTIYVPQLVANIVSNPGEFVIGALWARIDAFGRSLRTIALYGDDLGDSALFKDILPRLRPFRVALRNLRLDAEVLSLSIRAEVGFTFSGEHSLQRADDALAFVTATGFLDWDKGHSVI